MDNFELKTDEKQQSPQISLMICIVYPNLKEKKKEGKMRKVKTQPL